MKLAKIACVLLASSIIASTANASNILVQSQTNDPNYIHTLQVKNTGARLVNATMVLTIGVLHGSLCSPVRTTTPSTYTIKPNTTTYFKLSGDAIATNLGLGYTCMDITLKTDKQTNDDTFKLYDNGQTYFATQPNSDDLTVN